MVCWRLQIELAHCPPVPIKDYKIRVFSITIELNSLQKPCNGPNSLDINSISQITHPNLIQLLQFFLILSLTIHSYPPIYILLGWREVCAPAQFCGHDFHASRVCGQTRPNNAQILLHEGKGVERQCFSNVNYWLIANDKTFGCTNQV
jgi:hypothetical protein